MKRAPWLLIPTDGTLEVGRLRLDAAEARHATGALRLRNGSAVALTDGQGAVAYGTLVLERRAQAAVVIERVDCRPKPVDGVTLAVAILAGSAMDMVVQKSVELGVERLIPVLTERSQGSLERASSRCDHWRRVGLQALKQCRRAWAMEIARPATLAEVAGGAAASCGAVAHPEGGPVEELPPHRGRLLLIGPEGGFSAGEEQMLDTAGWPRVSLGRHVLRTETAAIAGAALLIARIESGSSGLNSPDV